jgi:hypothetical protein
LVADEDRQASAHAADIAANGRHAYLSRGLVVLRTLEGLEMTMSNESRRLAGILLIVLPTVMYGGVSLLSLLVGDPEYMDNPLRQDLWRAGHSKRFARLLIDSFDVPATSQFSRISSPNGSLAFASTVSDNIPAAVFGTAHFALD